MSPWLGQENDPVIDLDGFPWSDLFAIVVVFASIVLAGMVTR